MVHTVRDTARLVNRVRRIRGQVEAVERALEQKLDCDVVLQRIAGCRGALTGLFNEVLEDHIRFHVVEGHGPKAAATGEELIEILRSYLR